MKIHEASALAIDLLRLVIETSHRQCAAHGRFISALPCGQKEAMLLVLV